MRLCLWCPCRVAASRARPTRPLTVRRRRTPARPGRRHRPGLAGVTGRARLPGPRANPSKMDCTACSGGPACRPQRQDTQHSQPPGARAHKSSSRDPSPPNGQSPFSAKPGTKGASGMAPHAPIPHFTPLGPGQGQWAPKIHKTSQLHKPSPAQSFGLCDSSALGTGPHQPIHQKWIVLPSLVGLHAAHNAKTPNTASPQAPEHRGRLA